jgi:hypothetical protein
MLSQGPYSSPHPTLGTGTRPSTGALGGAPKKGKLSSQIPGVGRVSKLKSNEMRHKKIDRFVYTKLNLLYVTEGKKAERGRESRTGRTGRGRMG